MPRRLLATCAALLLLGTTAPSAAAFAAKPDTWDGLTLVKTKKMDAAYLLPGADFRNYSKVMMDPTEVAFQKNWQRDYNNASIDLDRRISDREAQEILDKVRTGFEEVFQKEFAAAGYQVVTTPGPDVLRVRTAVANLYVAAPDLPTAGRSRTFSREAGYATVIIEVRDSVTGALLGRAVDGRTTGDTGPYIRNSVTNTADFTELFKTWAKTSINGLNELKAQSPIAAPTETAATK